MKLHDRALQKATDWAERADDAARHATNHVSYSPDDRDQLRYAAEARDNAQVAVALAQAWAAIALAAKGNPQ
ncbi:hypothetical protein [Kitasatospora sp. NPDC004289]